MKLIRFIPRRSGEHLSSHSGLALIGALLARTELAARANRAELTGCGDARISHGDVLSAMIGLLCLGKPDFEAVETVRDEPFFQASLGLAHCPSSATLRQRLDMADGEFDRMIPEESARLIRNVSSALSTVTTGTGPRVPLDIDVSPFDNSNTRKEGVSRTYKGTDGYAPIFGYLGAREGYLVHAELREGSHHCQKGTPAFLDECLTYSRMITDQPVLVRMDSGNDCRENIRICAKHHVDWLIKRNLRKEKPEMWLEWAQQHGEPEQPRDGKRVWRGSTERAMEDMGPPVRLVYEVIERTIVKGQRLLIPSIEVNTWWCSLPDPEPDVIRLYHDHGTSEQFHSELKSDMGLERLPSGNFLTNALVLLLGMFAYNLLRLCGQESLLDDDGTTEFRPSWRRRQAGRRRIRTVIQDLMYVACRVIRSGRRVFLSFGRFCPWFDVWARLYRSFQT